MCVHRQTQKRIWRWKILLLHADVALLFSEGSRHFLFFSTQLQILKHITRDSDVNVLQSTSLHGTVSKVKKKKKN